MGRPGGNRAQAQIQAHRIKESAKRKSPARLLRRLVARMNTPVTARSTCLPGAEHGDRQAPGAIRRGAQLPGLAWQITTNGKVAPLSSRTPL
jgi:hypothetical protein